MSVFRQIPDFLSLDQLASTKQSILVVGGGFLGSELAVALASQGGWAGRGGWATVPCCSCCSSGKVHGCAVTQLSCKGGAWVRRVEGWDEEGGAGEGERRLEGKLNLLLSVNVYQAKRVNLL